jgi:hypothetical protein
LAKIFFLKHAEITSLLNVLFSMFIRKRQGKCKVHHAPFSVRLSLNNETDDDKIVNVLQPDGKYDLGAVYDCDEKAPVHIFEGLEIDLNELFECE